MPRRVVFTRTHPSGLVFGFWPDKTDLETLHIVARHGTTTEEAMATYFAGQTRWDAVHLRFETFSATHGLYWFWWERGRRVGVISCFRLDEDDADD